MKRFIGLLGVLLTASLMFTSPAVADQVNHSGPEWNPTQIEIKVTTHSISANSIITDKVVVRCDVGCGAAGTYRINNVRIELRGPAGALLWSKDNVSMPSGGAITFWPNVQSAKGAYWEIPLGFISLPDRDQFFWESWKVWPTGPSHPTGYGVNWV